MLVEIYYEVDNFNKFYGEKISEIYHRFGYTPVRKMGRLTMNEIMTILILYHYSHYKDLKNYYLEYISKELFWTFSGL